MSSFAQVLPSSPLSEQSSRRTVTARLSRESACAGDSATPPATMPTAAAPAAVSLGMSCMVFSPSASGAGCLAEVVWLPRWVVVLDRAAILSGLALVCYWARLYQGLIASPNRIYKGSLERFVLRSVSCHAPMENRWRS